jgi:hypothetical protein
MKRREIILGGCARESSWPEMSTEEERSLKRHGIRSEVSREDTICSKSSIEENKFSWLVRDVVTSKEDGVQRNSANTTKNSDESLQEGV